VRLETYVWKVIKVNKVNHTATHLLGIFFNCVYLSINFLLIQVSVSKFNSVFSIRSFVYCECCL